MRFLVLFLVACTSAAWPEIHQTTRGVDASIPATLDGAEARARQALAERDVVITRYEQKGNQRVLEGDVDGGLLRVVVEIDVESETSTRTAITAYRNVATWDRRFARALMDRIIILG